MEIVPSALHIGIRCLVVSLVASIALPANVPAYRFGDTVTQTGSEQTLFDWSKDRCNRDDFHIPDAPTRAIRDYRDQIQLIVSHAKGDVAPRGSHTRRLIGTDLADASSFRVNCTVIHSSHGDPAPYSYDNWEWLTSFWTEDGLKINALVHNEFHGWDFPGFPGNPSARCTIGSFTIACWFNSITAAHSTNGGDSYQHVAAPGHLVAGTPYRYYPNTGPAGYFQPSNIIKRDGYFFAMVRAETHGGVHPQRIGACLLRTSDLDQAGSWRAWDGDASDDTEGGFTIRFLDRYRETTSNPASHVCEVVSPDQPSTGSFEAGKMSGDLTYNSDLNRYLLVDIAARPNPAGGAPIWGVYYTLSTDLVDWSERQLLLEVTAPWLDNDTTCGEDWLFHPSVIDPASTDRNFSTTSQHNHLYLTRQRDLDCAGAYHLDRDLIRIPFSFNAAAGAASSGARPTRTRRSLRR